MAPIFNKPMLQMIVNRIRTSKNVSEFVVATTARSEDDEIEGFCVTLGIPCFRGSESDVLDRIYQTAHMFKAEIVVRLTADNPLVDGGFIDEVANRFVQTHPALDYASTSLGGGYPIGLSVEIFTFAALATAWKEDCNLSWREHVTPFLYKHPERFRTMSLKAPEDMSHWRWTVDTLEDLKFVQTICDRLSSTDFPWREAASLLKEEPELAATNTLVRQRNV